MFIEALFTIAKTQKQPKCSSTEECLKQKWYIYTEEYYSAMKKNLITSSAVTWVDLEITILGGVRERQITYEITSMWRLNYDTNELIYKTEMDSET